MNPAHAPDLARSLGMNPDSLELRGVSGGDIARGYRLSDGADHAFIKCMDAAEADVLEAERVGLEALERTGTVRVPRVRGCGKFGSVAWLALEWMDMRPLKPGASARLGVEIAELHQRSAGGFGFDSDNFIGRTPQPNPSCLRWSEFFVRHRLAPQLQRLDDTHPRADWKPWIGRLEMAWNTRFGDYQPRVSLIHGDLWSGNAAQSPGGKPIVYDPAVHYADRECDLAMADLFGGFHPDFFAAYRGTWPLEPGFEERRRYYQLYHLLNHANLFGGHYFKICKRLMADLVA